MANARQKRLVFVSHSGQDTWVARQLARCIVECGATPFLDEAEIHVGADFEDVIFDFLNKAHEVVVLFTPWALARPYVWAELGAARSRGIPIVALLLGLTAAELQARPEVPAFVKERNVIPLNDVDAYFAELRQRTQRPPASRRKGAP